MLRCLRRSLTIGFSPTVAETPFARSSAKIGFMPRILPVIAFLLAAGTSAGAEPGVPAARHWSLQRRSRPVVPTFRNPQHRAWVRTAVDAFLLVRLSQEGLRPAPEADRPTLIRR